MLNSLKGNSSLGQELFQENKLSPFSVIMTEQLYCLQGNLSEGSFRLTRIREVNFS